MRNTPLRVIDPRLAGDADVVGVGDDLSVPTLVWAYRNGIFPWPMDQEPLLWFCPPERAVLDFADLHIPKRLARRRRNAGLTVTFDRAFRSVITACCEIPRPGHAGTWITPNFLRAYVALHDAGHAHSVEVWTSEGALVGGLYGVSVGGAFAGESMFHRVPDASKLALLHLVDHLSGRGLGWIDIQMLTPHMAALGARLIPRAAFLDRLDETSRRRLTLFSPSSVNS